MIAFQAGELVTVLPCHDPLPTDFTWRGRRHRIRKIDRYGTRMFKHGKQVEVQRLFRLWTVDGMRCLLSQDVNRDAWRMERIF